MYSEMFTQADQFAQEQMKILQDQGKVRVGQEKQLLDIFREMHRRFELEQLAGITTREELEKRAAKAAADYQSNLLSAMDAKTRQGYLKNSIANEKREQDRIKKEEAAELARLRSIGAAQDEIDAKQEEYARKRAASATEVLKMERDLIAAKDEERKANAEYNAKRAEEMADGAEGMPGGTLNKLSKMNPAAIGAALKADATNKREEADTAAKELEELKAAYEQAKKDGADEETLAKILEEGQAKQIEATEKANKAAAAEMASAIADAISGDYKKAVSQAESILNDYKGIIDARLQGSDKTFKGLANTISSNLATSPYVKTTDVLNKLKEATEKGINYNLEQRTFLSSISDRIASTFDAFDSNLLRIIKLQQADTTATRLGMEASLTKLFNSMFQDTSYLSEVADSISGAIVDANSQLNHQASAEFEFIVQKWLGALSSLGMSSDSLTQIANGLNYLATGDVTNLANNNSLQTMFAMAASNANLEYSELLLNGLDASTTNKLLESMVVYLKDIADNSENQVVKAAYGDIFNLSLSDMKAISNLTKDEISTLAGTTMSYGDMQSEINNQMNQLVWRTGLATMLTNVYDNVLYGVASDMVNNPVTYSMQKMLDFMDEKKIDIAIPFINAMGFGLDLNTSVAGLMRMGLGIGQGLSLAGNIMSGLSANGGLDLNKWNASETTQRGSGVNLTSASTLGGVSQSIGTFTSNGNSGDVKDSTISSATDDAENTKKITNKNQKPPEKTMDDLFAAIIGDSAESYAIVKDKIIGAVYDQSTESLRVTVNSAVFTDGSLHVVDTRLNSSIDYMIKSIIGESATSFVPVQDKYLRNAYNSSSNSLMVSIGGLNFADNKLQVFDSGLKGSVDQVYTAIMSMSGKSFDTGTGSVKVTMTGSSFENGSLKTINTSLNDSVSKLCSDILGASASSFVAVQDKHIKDSFDSAASGLRVIMSGTSFSESALQVVDTKLNNLVEVELPKIRELMETEYSETQTVKLAEGTIVNIPQETLEAAMNSVLYDGETDSRLISLIKHVMDGETKVSQISSPVEVKNVPYEKLQVSNLVW